MKTENELKISVDDFKLIKQFYPEFSRKEGIKSNDFIIGWSELMPVVEKIEELYKKDFDPTEWVDSVLKGEPKKGEIKYMDVIALPLASKIDEAYKNVVDFIRWYNSQNS